MGSTLHGYWGAYKVRSVGSLDAAESSTVSLAFGQPVDVKRVILVNTEVHTSANSKLTIGVRDRDDSPSADHSAYTLPFAGSALGDVFTLEVGEPDTDAVVAVDDLDTHAATPILLAIDVDEEFFITSDAGGDAGIYDVYVQVQELGFHVGAANTNTSVQLAREAV